MDPRRPPRTLIDPKVRQVGFVTPSAPPDRTQSGTEPSSSPPVSNISPSGNSLSPVMIPPPRHASDSFVSSRMVPFPAVPLSPLRRPSAGESIQVGSFPSDFFPGTSPMTAASYKMGDDLNEDVASSPTRGWVRKGDSGRIAASSFPGGGFDLTAVKPSSVAASPLTTVSVVNMPLGLSETAGGASVEVQNERSASTKPLKEKTSKAERRALQEAQRAAKAAARGSDGSLFANK